MAAGNGGMGVGMFREHSLLISVVILDFQMPVMGGEEALPLLRELKPNVPIILSSGSESLQISAIARCGKLQTLVRLQLRFNC